MSRSLNFLRERCLELFDRRTLVFLAEGQDVYWPSGVIANVVLVGGGLNFLTRQKLWPPSVRFRLWTLSESHRKLLLDVFNLDPHEVSAIPRHLMLEAGHSLFKKRFFTSTTTLVFSGRTVGGKNHRLWTEVAYLIQKKAPAKVNVAICEPDFSRHRYVSPFPSDLKKHSWEYFPRFYGDLGKDWAFKLNSNSVLMNLSTYPQEDFGHSVAIAHANGWPLILSDWGGHKDVRSKNCIKIPAHLIFKNQAHEIARLCLAERTEEELTEFKSLKKPRPIFYRSIQNEIKKLPRRHIAFLRNQFSGDETYNKESCRKLRLKINHILAEY